MRTYVIITFLVLFSTIASAQKFKAGIIGGLVTSDIVGMDTLDHDLDFNKAGFVAGASLNLPLSNVYSAQIEMTYIQKGYSLPPDTLTPYFYKLSLDYIEVPLLIKRKIRFTVKEKTIEKFELESGLSFAKLVRHVEQDNSSSNIPSSNLIKNNYSFHFGVSYLFTPKFSLNVRFANSLNPVRPKSAIPHGQDIYFITKGTNTVWAFTLRYSFK